MNMTPSTQPLTAPLDPNETREEIIFALRRSGNLIAGLETSCLDLLKRDDEASPTDRPWLVAAMLARMERCPLDDENNEAIVRVLAEWIHGEFIERGADTRAALGEAPVDAIAESVPGMILMIEEDAWNEPALLWYHLLRAARESFFWHGREPDLPERPPALDEDTRYATGRIFLAMRAERWDRTLFDELKSLQQKPAFTWLEGLTLGRLAEVVADALREEGIEEPEALATTSAERPLKVAAGPGEIVAASFMIRGGPEGFVLEAQPDQSPTIEVSAPGTKAVIAVGWLEGVELELVPQGEALWLRRLPLAIWLPNAAAEKLQMPRDAGLPELSRAIRGRLFLLAGDKSITPVSTERGTVRFDLSALRIGQQPAVVRLIYQSG